MSALGMISEVWDRVSGMQPAPPGWEVAACAGAALVITWNREAWHVARNAITIAHEGGHAVVSLLTGRKLEGIRLHADTSGVTYSRGKRTGPGMVLTAAAGYVSPSLLGLGAAWLLAAHHVTAMLWLLLVLLGATFLGIRNAYGVLAVLATAAAVFAVSYFTSAVVQSAFSYVAAWFLLLGGIRPVLELQRQRREAMRWRQPLASDADQLARLTGVPGGAWVGVFGVVCLAALALGGWLLAPVSLSHGAVHGLSHWHVSL
ncbi:MAG TPA: M50 family metallopeptidase [Trebonia sp.]|nr:M50 family metallopeptidase [Trebonia sp.]